MMSHPARFGRPSPQADLVCLLGAAWLLLTLPALVAVVPDVAPEVLWTQAGIALVLLGRRAPRRLLRTLLRS